MSEMKTSIPRSLFHVYLVGRRAWHGYWDKAVCPYNDERRKYWREGFEDARLGQPDRYWAVTG